MFFNKTAQCESLCKVLEAHAIEKPSIQVGSTISILNVPSFWHHTVDCLINMDVLYNPSLVEGCDTVSNP